MNFEHFEVLLHLVIASNLVYEGFQTIRSALTTTFFIDTNRDKLRTLERIVRSSIVVLTMSNIVDRQRADAFLVLMQQRIEAFNQSIQSYQEKLSKASASADQRFRTLYFYCAVYGIMMLLVNAANHNAVMRMKLITVISTIVIILIWRLKGNLLKGFNPINKNVAVLMVGLVVGGFCMMIRKDGFFGILLDEKWILYNYVNEVWVVVLAGCSFALQYISQASLKYGWAIILQLKYLLLMQSIRRDAHVFGIPKEARKNLFKADN